LLRSKEGGDKCDIEEVKVLGKSITKLMLGNGERRRNYVK
jgi:hypothetical protein